MANDTKLIVKGLGGLDGEYEFPLEGMLTLGDPECLTGREGHRIKQITGLRMGEFMDAVEAGDSDTMIAIGLTVLNRAGKRVDEDTVWDAPLGSFEFAPIKKEEEPGDDADPPAKRKPRAGSGQTG